jgi:hypothetical protein
MYQSLGMDLHACAQFLHVSIRSVCVGIAGAVRSAPLVHLGTEFGLLSGFRGDFSSALAYKTFGLACHPVCQHRLNDWLIHPGLSEKRARIRTAAYRRTQLGG